MKICCVSFLLLVFTSCQYFNTERISSETFYEEEIKTIDWSEVDTYPMFKECEAFTEKGEQKSCFQNVINNAITKKLQEEKLVAFNELNDEVNLVLIIDSIGSISLKELKMDSITKQKSPQIVDILRESIQSLSNPAPAYKRGIPVNTTVKLPFILNSKEL